MLFLLVCLCALILLSFVCCVKCLFQQCNCCFQHFLLFIVLADSVGDFIDPLFQFATCCFDFSELAIERYSLYVTDNRCRCRLTNCDDRNYVTITSTFTSHLPLEASNTLNDQCVLCTALVGDTHRRCQCPASDFRDFKQPN